MGQTGSSFQELVATMIGTSSGQTDLLMDMEFSSRELNDEDEVCTAQRLAKLISINLKASSTNSSQFQGPKAPQHLNGHVPSQETCPSPL
ncbi:hypothetical protein V6N11_018976 [Hibiscus sabdariffa]|uniref:Uncharacterized protein n=1 Tax=Hibiscus sabdariffa TaxID=183260 RepID=A0ABR2R128_9ROSI